MAHPNSADPLTDTAVVALTGGIASGKTRVSNRFSELGVPVIDTDVIARQLIAHGTPLLEVLHDQFDANFFSSDGLLDRQKMRSAILKNHELKSRLEAIMHPAIREEVSRQLSEIGGTYCILVIPLLVEAGSAYTVDRVLVVDAPRNIQIARIMNRDHCNRSQAEAIISMQVDRNQRISIADDVIQNTGTISDLHQQVDELHNRYLDLFGIRAREI